MSIEQYPSVQAESDPVYPQSGAETGTRELTGIAAVAAGRHCARCGSIVAPNAPFCSTCGAPAALALRRDLYAGFWLRLGATLIDGAILFIAAFAAAVVAALVQPSSGSKGTSQVAGGVVEVAFVVLWWLYYTLMECSPKQGTLGKLALGLRVTDMEGRRISFARANGRFWGKALSYCSLYIGFMMAGWTQQKQALHDKLSSCLVVAALKGDGQPCWVQPWDASGAEGAASFYHTRVLAEYQKALFNRLTKAGLAASGEDGGCSIVISGKFVRFDEGSRFLRWLLPSFFLAGRVVVQVQGELTINAIHVADLSATTKKGGFGTFFGGRSESLLRYCAGRCARKVSRQVVKALKQYRPVADQLAAAADLRSDVARPPQLPVVQPRPPATTSQGICTMLEVCSNRRYRLRSLKEDQGFNQAVEQLKREGPRGAQALASLIDELLTARCAEISDALVAASLLSPQPELIDSVQRIIAAPPVIVGHQGRFPPVIIGGGKIGWDDGTAARIKQQASEVLALLGSTPDATAPMAPATSSQRCQVQFDDSGKVSRITVLDGQWLFSQSGQALYYMQKAGSLLQAAEILKELPSVPPLTYYVVDTPDGCLGRDVLGFYTEAPLRTAGLAVESRVDGASEVEVVSLTVFGDDFMKTHQTVAHLKQSGQYARLVLLMKCGRCGYESPVETEEGSLVRECYCCGAKNRGYRGSVNVSLSPDMIQI